MFKSFFGLIILFLIFFILIIFSLFFIRIAVYFAWFRDNSIEDNSNEKISIKEPIKMKQKTIQPKIKEIIQPETKQDSEIKQSITRVTKTKRAYNKIALKKMILSNEILNRIV